MIQQHCARNNTARARRLLFKDNYSYLAIRLERSAHSLYSFSRTSIKATIIVNSRIIFCLGWKSDTSLATQTKEIEARSDFSDEL